MVDGNEYCGYHFRDLCRGKCNRRGYQLLSDEKKEREADWRKYKYEQYKEFVISMSGVVGTDPTQEGRWSFAKACNTLHLIGSNGVLAGLHALLDEIGDSNPNKSVARHDALLSRLIWEIREDVGIPRTPEASEFSVRLWSPPPIQKRNR
jgi:hypothetical protein